jgi:parallel beta-helix repeat protein
MKKILILSIILINISFGSAFAFTTLNSSNWLGVEGGRYWVIVSGGEYHLDVPNPFSTEAPVAIWIRANNVTLDGKNILITGSSAPTSVDYSNPGPNFSGIRINSGPQTSNVVIKNCRVRNKYYGILLEWVDGTTVENCNVDHTQDGLTLWNCTNCDIRNSVYDYSNNGIVLDGHKVPNTGNVISGNALSYNSVGIILHLVNVGNTIKNNTISHSINFGISLPSGSHDNYMESNTLSYNAIGLLLQDSNNNQVFSNHIKLNSNRGIWLIRASENTIYNNHFSNTDQNVLLDNSSNNIWNVNLTSGTNIVGGPAIGGNYWGNPTNTGFSDNTPDLNGDGFCDQSYSVPGGGVDHLPLHKYTFIFKGIIYVNAIDSTCNGNYPCYTTIQDALDAPYEADIIKVAVGVYPGTIINETFDNVIEGGWDSNYETQTANSTFISVPIVIDGSITLRMISIKGEGKE